MPDNPNDGRRSRDPGTNLPAAPPLPRDVAELIDQRRTPILPTLNEVAEQVHLQMFDHPVYGERYRSLLSVIWRSQALEGSFPMDDSELARLYRDYAKEHRISLVANANLQSIVHSINVVRRRYRLDRKTRQQLANAAGNGAAANEEEEDNDDNGSE